MTAYAKGAIVKLPSSRALLRRGQTDSDNIMVYGSGGPTLMR